MIEEKTEVPNRNAAAVSRIDALLKEVLPTITKPEFKLTKAERRAQLARLRQHRPPIVYFLRCEGFIKIGFTRDLYNRTHVCQVGNPFPIAVAATLTGDEEIERRLQGKYSKLKHRNDWFREEGALADLIAAIGSMSPADARDHVDINVFRDGKARRAAMSRRWKLEKEQEASPSPSCSWGRDK